MITATAHRLLAALLLFGGLFAAPSPALAGETYNTCAGFIDSVPATISQQGVWCLRKDLSTSISSGNVITINVNNVTIDCNGFKLGGLAAGNASWARGINADNRHNITVRNCNVRGFYYGIRLDGGNGAGHLVEDNRLDNNLRFGIYVFGDNNRVRRNAVYDTGGHLSSNTAYAIFGYADIIDNTVSGLFADAPGGILYAISTQAPGATVRDNTVSGFDMTAVQGGSVSAAYGIRLAGTRQRATGNQVVGHSTSGSSIGGLGIDVYSTTSYCRNNDVGGFRTNIGSSCISSGNLIGP